MKRLDKISDTTLLNFIHKDRVICRYVLSNNEPVFLAEKGLDTFYGKTPREALRGLYILRRGEREHES